LHPSATVPASETSSDALAAADTVEQLCREGHQNLAAERWAEAKEAFCRALEADPRNATALYGRAASLLIDGSDQDEAHHVLRRALFLHPRDPRLLLAYAQLLTRQDDADGAFKAFERALAADPANKQALKARIAWLLQQKRFDAAEPVIAQALNALPGDRDILAARANLFYSQKHYDEAVEELAGLDDNDAIERLIDSCTEAEIDALMAAITSRFPRQIRFLNRGAAFCEENERYEEAEKLFARTLAVAPANSAALVGRIRVLRRAGRFKDAETAIADALAKSPRDREVLSERGHLFFDQKLYDEATEAFSKADNNAALREAIDESPEFETGLALKAVLSRFPRGVIPL
jgi:tetratricopeptide (TPR) repeat protein